MCCVVLITFFLSKVFPKADQFNIDSIGGRAKCHRLLHHLYFFHQDFLDMTFIKRGGKIGKGLWLNLSGNM